MLDRRQLIHRGVAAGLAAAGYGAASAQELPTGTIRLLVPYSPGGTPDLIARLVGQQLAEQAGVSLVVENKLGANGIIASETLARAKPDGSTLLLQTGSHAINPSIYKKLPYDSVQDFAPVSLLAVAPALVLVVSPQFEAKTFKEFLAMARKPGSQITFGSPGLGNTLHLAGELLKVKAGVKMLHVPYKGAAPALQAVMSGDVSATFLSTVAALNAIKGGQVRPLAVTSATRLTSLPDVPTIAESGVPGFDYNGGWMGIFAPAGTPPATVKRLSQEFAKALEAPAVREKMLGWDLPPIGSTPAEFASFLQAETKKFAAIVEQAQVPRQ